MQAPLKLKDIEGIWNKNKWNSPTSKSLIWITFKFNVLPANLQSYPCLKKVFTDFDLIFLKNLGAMKSSGWMSICVGEITGVEEGCCIPRKVCNAETSDSYELSAIVRPCEASLHAAIHRQYCSSWNVNYKRIKSTKYYPLKLECKCPCGK